MAKKRERKKWVMTQWHQQSPVPTLKLLPSPPPLLAKLCPSPWAGHNLARRGGGEGGGGGGGLYFTRKNSSKNSLSKNGQSFPLSWPSNSQKMEGGKMAHPHACCDGMWVAMRKRWEQGKEKRRGKRTVKRRGEERNG